jgi:hypothetical protein
VEPTRANSAAIREQNAIPTMMRTPARITTVLPTASAPGRGAVCTPAPPDTGAAGSTPTASRPFEAVELPDELVVAVLWHPEVLWHTCAHAMDLLRGFAAECVRTREADPIGVNRTRTAR